MVTEPSGVVILRAGTRRKVSSLALESSISSVLTSRLRGEILVVMVEDDRAVTVVAGLSLPRLCFLGGTDNASSMSSPSSELWADALLLSSSTFCDTKVEVS
jgi:hypothetical protein